MPYLESGPLVTHRVALLMSTVPQAAHTFSCTCMCLQGLHICTPCVQTLCQAAPVCTCTHAVGARPHPHPPPPSCLWHICMHIACLLWSLHLTHAEAPQQDPLPRLHPYVLRGMLWAAGAHR